MFETFSEMWGFSKGVKTSPAARAIHPSPRRRRVVVFMRRWVRTSRKVDDDRSIRGARHGKLIRMVKRIHFHYPGKMARTGIGQATGEGANACGACTSGGSEGEFIGG
jgi:hypothetical protein